LHPASNSSIKSFGFFIRSPSISEDRLHKMIYTLNLTGAPGSHQRTWAEYEFFECFHSMIEIV
jgi:hypothetical protein